MVDDFGIAIKNAETFSEIPAFFIYQLLFLYQRHLTRTDDHYDFPLDIDGCWIIDEDWFHGWISWL